jgi:hypothetical protein
MKFLKNRNTGKLDTVTTCIDYPRMKFTDYAGETDNYVDTGMKGSTSHDSMGLGGIPSVFSF